MYFLKLFVQMFSANEGKHIYYTLDNTLFHTVNSSLHDSQTSK